MGGIPNAKSAVAIAYRVRTHGGAPDVRGSVRKYPVTVKSCSVCASEFVARGKSGLTKHLCSVGCRNEYLRTYKKRDPQYWKDCEVCGVNFYRRPRSDRCRQVFCSQSCMYKARNKHARIPVPCTICGTEVIRDAKRTTNNVYCGYVCLSEAKKRELPRTNNPGSVRVWFSRYDRMSECEECGYSEVPGILVLHHKDRNRANNDLSNLKVLCPNCHAIEHLKENKEGWKHTSARAYPRLKKVRDEAQVS